MLREIPENMEAHRMFRVTLTFLLCSGLYLPTIRKFVSNKYIISSSKFLGKVLPLGALVYTTALIVALFDPETPALDKVFNTLAAIVCYTIIIKTVLFKRDVWKVENLIKIWDEMRKEMREFCPRLGEKMLLKRKKTTDIWSITFGFLLAGVTLSTGILPFFSRKIEHPTGMPSTAASPQFEILCTFELIVTTSLCFLTNGYNCFLMQMVAFEDVLCNYLAQTLDIIMRSLNVSGEGKMTYDSKYHPPGNEVSRAISHYEICADVEKKLRAWINLHQKLIRYNAIMQDLYQFPLFLDYIGLILTIAIIAFLVVSGSLNAAMAFNCAAYIITTYTIFYVSCYYGDLVELSSENLFRDAFGRSWYTYPGTIRSAYLFIIMRCRKPLTLKAFNMYPLDSRSFGLIFNHSFSFLMFLLQVSHRSK